MKLILLIITTLCFLAPSYDAHLFQPNENVQQFRATKKDPCSTLKCATNELCVLKDAESAVCLLRKDMPELPMFINKRQVKTTVCSSQECKYGQCEIVSPDGYKCHCDNNGIFGTNCDTFLANSMPCASNPCWGNSECVNLNKNEYECKCKAGRGGKDCIGHIHPCKCQNGGFCSLIGNDIYSCKCPRQYGGYLCQYKLSQKHEVQSDNQARSCFESPCLNGGTCTIYSVCLCKPSYTGLFCENYVSSKPVSKGFDSKNFELNICSKNMCLNGGTCSQLTQSIAVCLCRTDYSGPFCNIRNLIAGSAEPISTTSTRTTTTSTTTTSSTTTTTLPSTTISYSESSLTACPNTFNSVCLNNGSCYIVSNSVLYCLCDSSYSGPFCENKNDSKTEEYISTSKPVVLTTNKKITQLKIETVCPSLFRILCQNGGTCHVPMLKSASSSYYCECLPGYSGPFCNYSNNEKVVLETTTEVQTTTTTKNPASVITSSSLIIECPIIFRGLCQNGGMCQLVSGTSTYFCRCTEDFTGPFCNLIKNQ